EQDHATRLRDIVERQARQKSVAIARRNRHLRLAEEVQDQLGRIVSPGILEVEKDKTAVGVRECIVKAEIGGRQAAFGFGQLTMQIEAERAGLARHLRAYGFPHRAQRREDKTLGFRDMRRLAIERSQAQEPALDKLQMIEDREAGVRSGRKPCKWPRIDSGNEISGGIDMPDLKLHGSELTAGNKAVERRLGAIILRQRPRNGPDAVAPGAIKEIPFGRKPVAVIARVGEIALHDERRARIALDAKNLVVPPAIE